MDHHTTYLNKYLLDEKSIFKLAVEEDYNAVLWLSVISLNQCFLNIHNLATLLSTRK